MSINRVKEQINISDDTDTTSKTSGSLVTSGGVGVVKDVFIGGEIKLSGTSNYTGIKAPSTSNNNTFTLPADPPATSGYFLISDDQGALSFTPGLINNTYTFNGVNNQSTPANVTDMFYSSGSFEIDVTINVLADTNLSELVKLSGISNPTTGWSLNSISITGDNIGIGFTISGGQVLYTSPSFTGFVSLIFSWTEINSSVIPTNLVSGSNTTGTPNSSGNFFTVNNSTFTDTATAGSGTLTTFNSTHIGAPTLAASNTSVTTTTANTVFIEGAPVAGTNETITNAYSLNIGGGNSLFGGDVSITGSISKGSGTFKIEHPLDNARNLVHSFIEGPRCDNIYRGEAKLINGCISVDIDRMCTETKECSMTKGTFEALNRNSSCFLQNNDTFDNVKGVINGGILNIYSNNKDSDALINWMVIGERKDAHIKNSDITNNDGNLITEK